MQLTATTTRDQLLAQIAARNLQINLGTEVVIDAKKAREVSNRAREVSDCGFTQNPREVYKEEKIKRSKDSSRTECVEQDDTASYDAELAASHSLTFSSSLPSQSLRSELAQNSLTSLHSLEVNSESFSQSGPQEVSSRAITGITAQHHKTESGIKVAINLQTSADIEDCSYLKLTAELKRGDRLRELKPYEHDSEEFANAYASLIDEMKKMKPADRSNLCIGRVHARGKRAAWFADTVVVGRLDDKGVLEKLEIYIEDQQLSLTMTETMSAKQREIYHCAGIFGQIVLTNKAAPTIWTAPRTKHNAA